MERRTAGALLTLAFLMLLECSCAYDNGVGARPPMGWNTWCTDDACGARDYCTEQEVRSVAEVDVLLNL
jgi:hypothetical protein